MADYTLEPTTVNNQTYLYKSLTIDKQNNVIDISAGGKYVPSNIQIEIKVTKAVLNSSAGSNTFDIQVPNGNASPVIFHFAVDANGNTTVTSGTVS